MRRSLLVLGLLAAVAAGCGGSTGSAAPSTTTSAPSTTSTIAAGFDWSLDRRTIGDRSYLLSAPDDDTVRPLVLAFHGRGDDALGMANMTGLHAIAAANGFAVAYLEGLHEGWSDSAAEPPLRPDAEADIRFAEAVAAAHAGQGRPVAVVGFSNGASFSLRLAAERSALVSAVAAVAGQLAAEPPVAPTGPVPLLLYYGDADEIRPITGIAPYGEQDGRGPTPTIGAEPSAAAFAAAAGASERTVAEEAGRTRTRWRGGAAPVDLVVLHGFGHGWPPGATAEIVAFLRDR